ncbi:MAG: hypothetical protein II038_05520 [Lachnospiraceae bacterium]|nr:hypothetical protein [Lachnospiraceae bacterium]
MHSASVRIVVVFGALAKRWLSNRKERVLLISVSSVLRGVPADFASVQTAKSVVVPISNNVERVPYVDSFARNSYYANYELFSTFTPDEYDRLTMRFPSLDDD